MILHTTHIPCQPAKVLDHLRTLATPKYQPLTQGYTYCHALHGLPNFKLIEGVAVPSHNDGVPADRPILMLHNPSNNYVIRGTGQYCDPQSKGTMVVLDISADHEVHSIDPLGGHGPWLGVVWEPGGQPCLKSEWELGDLVSEAENAFGQLIGVVEVLS